MATQAQVIDADRLTLIYSDDSTRRVHGCRVRSNGSRKEILVEAQYVPREHVGMDVVAASDSGSVWASFEVEDMWMESGTRVYSSR